MARGRQGDPGVTDWNFADVWETVASVRPGAPALCCGPRRLTWEEFDRRADRVAAGLLAAGLGRQAKVAQYLYNCPEYLESLFGAFKVGMVPVNTNYRYTEEELAYLWDNADVEVVVFHGSFAERAAAVRGRLGGVREWWWVEDGSGACPQWATPYEEAAHSAVPVVSPARPVHAPWGRSGDDLLLVYTGGTTGMPKGVMWRQDDLFAVLNRTGEVRYPEHGTVADVRRELEAPCKYPPARLLPGPPLMHGTGLFTAMSVLDSAGSVVMLESRHFDPDELLDTIEAERVTELSIVGDAFAKPLLAALDANPGRWDISSLWLVISSGVMWSAEVKSGLLAHNPKLTMVDSLGSSEAVGIARSTSRSGETAATAGFQLGPDARVLDDDGLDVAPGSGVRGRVALRGRGPLGYYKDPGKTASTFLTIDGERWTVPGDFATVGRDGSVRLLGRGSVCINTGGEKVFPEEVEEVIKLHPGVADAVVVGVPDDRFGETVVAVVEPAGGAPVPDAGEVSTWVRSRLAAYKAPRSVVLVDSVSRSPSGKVDYRRLRELAIDEVRARAGRSPS
jgi:acyl-CoA synthetase (AMP-forming)/AMP-acid ligase II